LPDGNRNLIFGAIIPPPGYNLETTADIATIIETEIQPLWEGATGEADHTRETTTENADDPDKPPRVSGFFFVASGGTAFLGAAARDPARVKDLIPIMRNAAYREPGTFGLISQRSLFARGIGGGRSINLDVTGPHLETILDTTLKAVGKLSKAMPASEGTQIRPRPGLELGAPEIRIEPDRLKLADTGVRVRDLGDTLDAFNDGLRVAEITVGNKRMDLTLKGPFGAVTKTQGIGQLPVVTKSGNILPASSLANVVVTSGPTEIRHLERQRSVTLEIRPPEEMPLEVALDLVNAHVIGPLTEEGLPEGVQMRLSGTADKLSQTWDAMVIDLIVAVIIVYLAIDRKSVV